MSYSDFQSDNIHYKLSNVLHNVGGSSRIWIGLHCLRYQYWFEWTNGETVQYVNWQRREPNNAGPEEDCVHMYPNVGMLRINYLNSQHNHIVFHCKSITLTFIC